LGTALTFTIVYIWSRKNPNAVMNFLGIFNFPAPLMPFILTLVSIFASNEIPLSDVLGIITGHLTIIIEELFPFFLEPKESINIPH
jgi:Derlin-2/3